eukprot:13204842-Ditylum_brightwellii.AAC.1
MIEQYLHGRNEELIMPLPHEPQLEKWSDHKPSPKPSPTSLPNVDLYNHPCLLNRPKNLTPKPSSTILPSDTAISTDIVSNHSLICLPVTTYGTEIDMSAWDPITLHMTEIDTSTR